MLADLKKNTVLEAGKGSPGIMSSDSGEPSWDLCQYKQAIRKISAPKGFRFMDNTGKLCVRKMSEGMWHGMTEPENEPSCRAHVVCQSLSFCSFCWGRWAAWSRPGAVTSLSPVLVPCEFSLCTHLGRGALMGWPWPWPWSRFWLSYLPCGIMRGVMGRTVGTNGEISIFWSWSLHFIA